MIIDFTDPIIQAFAAPFIVALAFVGILKAVVDGWRGSLYGALAIGSGFLVTYFLMHGFNLWPVQGAIGVLPWAVLAGIAVGVLFDEMAEPELLWKIVWIGLPLGIGFWIGIKVVGKAWDIDSALKLAATIIAGAWILQRFRDDCEAGLAAPISVIAALAGMAVAAHVAGETPHWLTISLGMATAGYAVWNWPKYRFPWGGTATFSVGAAMTGIIGIWLVNHDWLGSLPVAVALSAFLVHPLIVRNFDIKPAAAPIAQILLSALPVAAAAMVAQLTA